MTSYQSKVYECSRQNASVLLNDNGTEWINEFKQGIKLDKGDQIRILGSFVNEQAQGDEIEITDEMSINIVHTPYIKGNTLATADTQNDLLDLGMFGDVAYSTDATGVEPPLESKNLQVVGAGNTQVISEDSNYNNPTSTRERDDVLNPGNVRAEWNNDASEAATWGTTINTSRSYGLFSDNTIDNELYLGQIVKKFILPVLDGYCNRMRNLTVGAMDTNYGVNDDFSLMEALTLDTSNFTATQAGRFGGAPQPGFLIATANICGSYGWYAANGEGIWQTNYNAGGATHSLCGVPNLIGGVDSMIGKIIAVRPIQKTIDGFHAGSFEILVTDWINPASIKKGYYEHTFSTNTYKTIKLPSNPSTAINPATESVTCRKPPHGAGLRPNGYNKNPAFNPINGLFNQYAMQPFIDNTTSGSTTGFNIQANNLETINPWASTILRTGSDDGSTTADTEYNLGLQQPWGLSFPYNGGHCSQLRTIQVNHEQRANSYSIFRRDPPIGNPLSVDFQMYDLNIDYAAVPSANGYIDPTSEPQIMGAYICCNETVMMDIVKNGQNLSTEANFGSLEAGRRPRIWFEYGNQNYESNYKERHYVSNTISNSTGVPVQDTTYQNRYGYDMCGKPDNKNWKQNNHNFGSITPPALGVPGATGVNSNGEQNTVDLNFVSAGEPIIYSSPTGFRSWNTTNAQSNEGAPFEWCGYNNPINSVYFQQKDTGATNLSFNNVINKNYLILNNSGVGLTIDIHDPVGGGFTLTEFMTVKIMDNTVTQACYTSIILGGVTPIAGGHRITLNSAVSATTIGTQVWIGSRRGEWEVGAGVNAQPWASDCLMIKNYLTKIDVPSGYYTKEQLGARINDVLHYKTLKYKLEDGTELADGSYQITSSVGLGQEAYGSEPTMVTGNFLHSYIPEVSYGFTPVTSDNATQMDLTASTKDLTNEVITYDYDGTFYTEGTLPTYNGTTARYVWETDTKGKTWFGKHIKLYSIPYLPKQSSLKSETHLIRLKGGSLLAGSYNTGALPNRWNISSEARFSGILEPLRTQEAMRALLVGAVQGTSYTYIYRNRGIRNVLTHGGSAKIFCGSNNISIEFNDLANRFNIFNLYTPIRPHASENPGDTSFSIDDAVPSAIINMRKTGEIDDSLSGLYISNLNGGEFSEVEWGRSWFDNWRYDTDSNTTILQYGDNLLEALGYTPTQLLKYEGNGIYYNKIPYTYIDELTFFGKMLRGAARITPAINGSNPFSNDCLNINPVEQYYSAVESEDFFADDPPTLGTSPYYFIGSDLPVNHFMGNDTGTKLPVVGINARNFHSFGFSFDVGATSVEYTIDRPTTITSITTAIYDSNLKKPTNISKYSSVIYLLIKNNYYKQLPPQLIQQGLQQQLKIFNPQTNPQQYFQVPYSNLRTEPPVNIPQNYNSYQWNNSLLDPLLEEDEDLTTDEEI